MMPGVDGLWQLTDGRARWQTTIVQIDAKTAEKIRGELFSDAKSPFIAQMVGALHENQIEIGTLGVQGRELRVRRFLTDEPDESAKEPGNAPPDEPVAEEESDEGPQSMADVMGAVFKKSCAVFDITPEGQPGMVVLAYAKLNSLARVPDDELVEFFEPFHIGPNR
jgi:hypothetical protein